MKNLRQMIFKNTGVNGDIGNKIRVRTMLTVFRNILRHIQITANERQIELVKDRAMMQNITLPTALGIAGKFFLVRCLWPNLT